jgi:hypothetical protein
LGDEEQNARAILDFRSQFNTEIVSGFAGLIVPDTVLFIVQKVEDRIYLLGIAVGVADEQIGLVAGICLEFGLTDGIFCRRIDGSVHNENPFFSDDLLFVNLVYQKTV